MLLWQPILPLCNVCVTLSVPKNLFHFDNTEPCLISEKDSLLPLMKNIIILNVFRLYVFTNYSFFS